MVAGEEAAILVGEIGIQTMAGAVRTMIAGMRHAQTPAIASIILRS